MDELAKYKTVAVHVAAAGASAALGTASTYPLDTLKTLIQVGSSSGKTLAVPDVLYRVGLLSGFQDGREDDYVSVSEALMAGFAAGMTESFVSSPFELLKLRAQVSAVSHATPPPRRAEKSVARPLISRLLPRSSMDMTAMSNSLGILSTLTTKHANISDALKEYPWLMTGSGRPPAVSTVQTPSEVISLEGWTALWRGLRPGIVRDSIFGGVFFSSWQFLHQVMLYWKAAGMDPIPRYDKDIGPLSPISVSLAAGVSGSFAAAVSHGFDTARSRSQCTVLPKYLSMERRLLKWKRPGKRFERLTGIHPSDKNLLLNGIGLRMARCGLASSIIVGSYLFAVGHLLPD
ncbi:uncharacterized protein LOC127261144 isoform X2 [Andrographis paniculata]|uniref:uncharacterized protein LOC127261144 isoform X2 n=1 Tax=Andrographis paniculata TaxID=175694 RepID=UPI0021E829E6|nr:uncharacterized protein LOC127261144 isoform X2 [Andrographis paniculata]